MKRISLLIAVCGLVWSATAQKAIENEKFTGTWYLDSLSIVEITENNNKIPVKYDDVKDIIKGGFSKAEIMKNGQCTLFVADKDQMSLEYVVTDSLLIIKYNDEELSYKYSLNNTTTLSLQREFWGGNLSGMLVKYHLYLRFKTKK